MPSVRVEFPKEMGGVATINIRDGESPQQAVDRRLASIQGFQEESVQDEATLWEGVGAGSLNTYRQLGNMLGMDNDDAIARQSEIDQGLGGWGQTGKLIGELAATAPIGAGVGTGAKVLGGAVRAARGASAGAKAGGAALPNTLAGATSRGVVEGGIHGGIFAGPDKRGEGAAFGAGLGGAMGAAGRGLGSMASKFRLTDITDEARAVQEMTKHHIPLSQSAKPGLVKNIYEALLANIPGVGGKYRQKYVQAMKDFRHFAATKAHPDDIHADVSIGADDSMGVIFQKLGKFWDEAYEPLNNTIIKVSRLPAPPKFLAGLLDKSSLGLQQLPKAGQMKAGNIRKIQQAVRAMVGKQDNPEVIKALKKYADDLEKVIERGMPKTPEGATTWKAYQNLREPYRNWVDLQTAGLKASGSEFSAKQLETAARRGMNVNLREGNQTVVQKAGEYGAQALADFPSKQGLFQGAAAMGLVGSAAMGSATFPAVLGGAIAAGKLMTTETFEKLISGQSKHLQQQAAKLKVAGYAAREIAVILGLEEEDAT